MAASMDPGRTDGRSDGPPTDKPVPWYRRARFIILLCGAIVLFGLGRTIEAAFIRQFDAVADGDSFAVLLALATGVYIMLLVIPFMPAVELGVCMLMVLGAKVALLIYTSTVAALTLAFLAGRMLPPGRLAKALGRLGLLRARDFLLRLEPLSSDARVSLILDGISPRGAGALVHSRYLLLAVLFNLPGNMMIGGGGGIGLVAGMSKLFSFPAYVLTVALAVAPVPLLVYIAEWNGG